MKPRNVTHHDLNYWQQQGFLAQPAKFVGSGEVDAESCETVLTSKGNAQIVRVPWTLSQLELGQLLNGGTLWLSIWGGLPAHAISIQPPESAS